MSHWRIQPTWAPQLWAGVGRGGGVGVGVVVVVEGRAGVCVLLPGHVRPDQQRLRGVRSSRGVNINTTQKSRFSAAASAFHLCERDEKIDR